VSVSLACAAPSLAPPRGICDRARALAGARPRREARRRREATSSARPVRRCPESSSRRYTSGSPARSPRLWRRRQFGTRSSPAPPPPSTRARARARLADPPPLRAPQASPRAPPRARASLRAPRPRHSARAPLPGPIAFATNYCGSSASFPGTSGASAVSAAARGQPRVPPACESAFALLLVHEL
jgi:hypothetical protein